MLLLPWGFQTINEDFKFWWVKFVTSDMARLAISPFFQSLCLAKLSSCWLEPNVYSMDKSESCINLLIWPSVPCQTIALSSWFEFSSMHDDRKVTLSHKSQEDVTISRRTETVVSTFWLTEWPAFLLWVFGNWRPRRRQQALTESCECTQQKLTPLPVACPLKVHVYSWHFFPTCLENTGIYPLGPKFVFKLSGMMQKIETTSVSSKGDTKSLILNGNINHFKEKVSVWLPNTWL